MKKFSLIFILSILLVGCRNVDTDSVGANNIVVTQHSNIISDNVLGVENNKDTIEQNFTNNNDNDGTYTKLKADMTAQEFLDNIRLLLPTDSVVEAVQSGGYNQFIVTSSDLDINYLINLLILNTEEELEQVDKELYVTEDGNITTMTVVVGNVSLLMQVPNDMYDYFYTTLYTSYLKDFDYIVSMDNWNKLDIDYLIET